MVLGAAAAFVACGDDAEVAGTGSAGGAAGKAGSGGSSSGTGGESTGGGGTTGAGTGGGGTSSSGGSAGTVSTAGAPAGGAGGQGSTPIDCSSGTTCGSEGDACSGDSEFGAAGGAGAPATTQACVCAADGNWRCFPLDNDCPPDKPVVDDACTATDYSSACPYDGPVVCRCSFITGMWTCSDESANSGFCPDPAPDDGDSCSDTAGFHLACDYSGAGGAGNGVGGATGGSSRVCTCDDVSEQWFCFGAN